MKLPTLGATAFTLALATALGLATASCGPSTQVDGNCGASGQVCCGGGACDGGGLADGGALADGGGSPSCGASGQACCAGGACNVGSVCNAGACTALTGQCSLLSAVNFGAGNAPGVPIPTSGSAFRAGYENDVSLFTANGSRRLLLMFNYGYGVMDLSNPSSPTALTYYNMLDDIPPRGDGQSFITSMSVAADGSRAVFSLGTQAGAFKAVVGKASGNSFLLKGDFQAGLATGGVVVQKTGDGRYIAYALTSRLMAADITSLPTAAWDNGDHVGISTSVDNIPSEVSAFPSGTPQSLKLSGNYLSYLSGTSVLVLDASSPGASAPNITAGFTQTTLSLADFGLSSGYPVTLSTAVDPADPSALYVLVSFYGSTTPGYSLMRVKGSTKTLIGSFPIPSVPGEQWTLGYSSALITVGSNVYAFMWANRETPPTWLFRLYTTTVSSFGSAPGVIDFDSTVYNQFGTGEQMRGFATSDGTVNTYMGTSATAYAISLSCH